MGVIGEGKIEVKIFFYRQLRDIDNTGTEMTKNRLIVNKPEFCAFCSPIVCNCVSVGNTVKVTDCSNFANLMFEQIDVNAP